METSFKTCPFCKEKIREEAIKCRYCGEWIEQVIAASKNPQKENQPSISPQPKPVESITPTNSKNANVANQKTSKGLSPKYFIGIGILLLTPSCIYLMWGLIPVIRNQVSPELGGKLLIGTVKMFIFPGLVCWAVKGKAEKLFAFSVTLAAMTLIAAYYAHDAKQEAEQKAQESNIILQIKK